MSFALIVREIDRSPAPQVASELTKLDVPLIIQDAGGRLWICAVVELTSQLRTGEVCLDRVGFVRRDPAALASDRYGASFRQRAVDW